MTLYSSNFWKAAFERAVKTAAQVALLVIGADQFVNALSVDWVEVGGFAFGGFILSLLFSVGSDALLPGDGPSATGVEVVKPTILGKASKPNDKPDILGKA